MRKTISGTNYEVSSNGEVFNFLSGKKIAPQNNGHGYLYVNLHVNGKHTKKYVHRLVAEAFIPNPDNKPCVNHKDGRRNNNSLNNLEWCTHEENISHGAKVLKTFSQYRTHNEKTSKPVVCFEVSSGSIIAKYESIRQASRAEHISKSSIKAALNGQQKTAAGKVWRWEQ